MSTAAAIRTPASRPRLEDDNRQLRDALAAALGQRRSAAILGQPDGRDTPNNNHPKVIGLY